MNYEEFLLTKQKKIQDAGFDLPDDKLNKNLFDFQKHIVKKALKKGRYAIFADCGLGKTLMQLEFANQVSKYTEKPVLILCPLAVAQQTINEAVKFGLHCEKYKSQISGFGVYITNYEQLDKIDVDVFSGIVLDESSILKNFTGKYKNLIIDKFNNTPYKLACTATPAPNDLNEIGNHSEFLDIMDAPDMRMRWFVRDNDINNYRIKRHAESDFYGWVASWASVLRKPSDIGFVDNNYNLPKLNYIEKYIEVKNNDTAQLFSESSVNATQFNKELKVTMLDRLEEVADIVNNSNENFIIWVNQNEEDSKLLKLIPDAISVRGSEKTEIKERKLLDFANNKFRVLITKKKIAQFGLNFQNCRNQVFASLDFSFEGLYQAIRRSYRFGQSKEVNIYIVAVNTMQNVVKSINKKQKEFNKMMEEITKNVNEKEYSLKLDYEKKVDETENYKIFNGDSCELLKEIETNSIDFSIFSPPFSNLFTYSDNLRDLGNSVDNEEFFKQNDFLLNELYRVVKNGRLVAIHSKDLAVYKNSSGYSGMYDFTGDYHRAMEKAGFKYHSKITIWIDPVLEMQRTKTQRLLHKQVTSDSSYSGIGMPEYVTIFRKWEGDEKDWQPVTNLNKDNFPVELWQKWASPVWFDIDRTNVMNSWRDGKNEKDEKHICPLQLDVIERLIAMYSNKNEKVLTPFMGIGSEVYQAVKMGRYGVGIELKESYFEVAKRNLRNLTELKQQQTIF
jgi:DNA modification methylase